MASSSAAVASAEGLLESVFLVLVYGFVMFRGSKLVNEGRQALVEIFTPGITSAMLLTFIPSLPTAIVILTSGFWGSKSTSQGQILIGIGSLAAHLRSGYGVENDSETSRTARIMIVSVLPFIIVQLLLVIEGTARVRLVILVSLVASVALMISFGLYQVFFPWVQSRRLAFVHHSDVVSLEVSDMRGLGRLLKDNGEPNIEALQKLFKALDSDSDGLLSASELRALILGIQFEEIDLGIDEALRKHLKEFRRLDDVSQMDMDEFISSMSKWLVESRHSLLNLRRPGRGVIAAVKFKHLPLQRQHIALLSDRTDHGPGGSRNSLSTNSPRVRSRDEAVVTVKNPGSAASTAALKLLSGALIVAASAYPLVDVVDDLSTESSLPSILISFVVIPFACYGWIWSALPLAGKKRPRILSLVFSEIYEVVTANNVFCFAVFLAVVYARDLTWKFSSEALSALVVTVVVGLIAGFKKAFPVWTSIVACVLYPLALAVVLLLR